MFEYNVWLDYAILALILILGVKGILNGLIREFFSLLGIVGGVLLASRLVPVASELISTYVIKISNPSLLNLSAFLAVLISFWLLCMLLSSILFRLIKMANLGALNKLGGFVFSTSKMFLIIAVITACLANIEFVNSKLKDIEEKSFVYPHLKSFGSFIINNEYILERSKELREQISSGKEVLQEGVQEAIQEQVKSQVEGIVNEQVQMQLEGALKEQISDPKLLEKALEQVGTEAKDEKKQ